MIVTVFRYCLRAGFATNPRRGCRRIKILGFLLASLLAAVPGNAVSVRDYGAVGDGVANDVGAFLRAIKAGADSREPVEVPPGRYLLGEDLVIDDAVQVVGVNHKESVLTSEGSDARILVRESGTSFRGIGFEKMVEPIGLVSREDYVLRNIQFEQCRFEGIEVRDPNRGAIGLSSGSSGQRMHRVEGVVVRDCVFRNIDAHAINIRANIRNARIVRNVFLGVVNRPGSASPSGGYAIRLGDSEEHGADSSPVSSQGGHVVEENVIRGMRKQTVEGNLMGLLLYGDFNVVRGNLIEDIDSTDKGLDTNAIYMRGSFNRVVSNTIRRIHGADDDGAVSLKGGMASGNRENVIASNRIEDIYGMSAVEVSTTGLLFVENDILNSPTRGFYHRLGHNVTVTGNRFVHADCILRTEQGTAVVAGNRFIDSRLSLEQRRNADPADREAVEIQRNHFQRTDLKTALPLIGLANDVDEGVVSIRGNVFRNLAPVSDSEEASLVDLVSGGTVQKTEIIGNRVDQAGGDPLLFRIGPAAGAGAFSRNEIVIRDLRGPILTSAFSTIEQNVVRIAATASSKTEVETLFVVTGHEPKAVIDFRNNRIQNEATSVHVDEVLRIDGPPATVGMSGNVIEGRIGRLADSGSLTLRRPDTP